MIILWACILFFCITLIMLFALYSGYRFIFGENYSGTKWGLWCLGFGVASYFIFNSIANYILTRHLAKRYLFLFLIVMFIAVGVYNYITTKDLEDVEDVEES